MRLAQTGFGGRLQTWAYRLALLIAAMCIAFLAMRAFNANQDFDGAYIATVSKNLAEGKGYLTTYQPIQGYVDRNREDPARLFNAEITTGPGMILPGAAFFALLGNHPWTAKVAAVTINLVLFGFAFLFVRSALTPARRADWQFFCAAAVMLLAAGTTSILHPGVQTSLLRHWYDFFGEIAASGYVVLGVLCAALGLGRWRPALAAGILFGLAAQTKSLAVLQILVIAPLLVWHFAAAQRTWKSTGLASAAMALGYAIPNLAMALWIWLSMSPQDYAEQLDATARLFSEAGSGLTQLRAADDPLVYLVNNFGAHVTAFGTAFSPVEALFGTVLIVACLVALWREAQASRFGLTRAFDPWLVAGGALLLAAAAHIGWWFLLEYGPWLRRLTQAMAILAIGAALVLMVAPGRWSRLIGIACALVLAAAPTWRIGEALVTMHAPDPQYAAAIELSQLLEKKEKEGIVSLGCAFDGLREIELMRPGQYNFSDCANIPPRIWGKPGILVEGPQFKILAANESSVQRVLAACAKPFYERAPYNARMCSADALKQNYIRVGLYDNGDGTFWAERVAIFPISDLGPPRDIALRLYSNMPDMAAKPLRGAVALSRGERELWRAPIELRADAALQDVTLPRDALVLADRLRIEVDRQFNPKKLGLGPDDRDLAVMVGFDPDRSWRGFHANSPDGRWMSGEGVISITPNMRRAPPRLSLFAANPDLARQPLFVTLSYLAGDQVLASEKIKLTSAAQLQEVALRAELLAKADRLELKTSRTYVPAKLGLGADTRTLGIIVRLLP